MIQAVEKYATMLKEFEIPEDVIEQALDIFQTVPVLMEQFCNPAADLAGKHRAIDKIFSFFLTKNIFSVIIQLI